MPRAFGKGNVRRKGAGKGGGRPRRGSRKGSRKGGGKGGKGATSALVCEFDPSEGDAPAPRIDESELTAGQRASAARALAGESLFLTGAAGTGKSFLLRFLVQELELVFPARVAVTASTGIAAANVGGQTIHSFAGVGLGVGSARKLVNLVQRSSKALERWRDTRVLVIDEISMLDSNLFSALDAIGKSARNSPAPFGGMQVILCGDFLQLPPVQGRGEPTKMFCFQAPAWKKNKLDEGTVVLTEAVRQAGDPEFAQVLNEIREGFVSPRAQDLLGNCCVGVKAAPTDGITPTKLYCRNVNVDLENAARLAQLPGQVTVLRARDHFKGVRDVQRRQQFSTIMDKKVPGQLDLKVGAQVIMLKNNPDLKLVNGSRGTVESFKDGRPVVRFDTGKSVHLGVERFTQGTSSSSLLRLQVPLKLGWAMTVHKAQGMTLSRAELQVDDAFEAGQNYVALSRLTCTAGLWIQGDGLQQSNTHAHPDVIDFYNRALSRQVSSTRQKSAHPVTSKRLNVLDSHCAEATGVDEGTVARKRRQPQDGRREAKALKKSSALNRRKLGDSPLFPGGQRAPSPMQADGPFHVQPIPSVDTPKRELQWLHFGAQPVAPTHHLQSDVSQPHQFPQAARPQWEPIHHQKEPEHIASFEIQELSLQNPKHAMLEVEHVPDAVGAALRSGLISCEAEDSGESVAISQPQWVSPPKSWGGGVIDLD